MTEIKITEPQVMRVYQEPGREGIFRMIERAAKTTTQIDKLSNNSEEWVEKNLIAKKHMRPLEFGEVYLITENFELAEFFNSNMYSMVNQNYGLYYITTNYRVLYEHKITHLLRTCMSKENDCTTNHVPRITLMWEIGRDIADEFRTHTLISSIMESSRYCCYTKGRFDGVNFTDVSFGEEWWRDRLIMAYQKASDYYEKLIEMGAPAEFARKVLPIGFRVHMMQSAFPEDWSQFFAQRMDNKTGKAHPDANYIASEAFELIKKEL